MMDIDAIVDDVVAQAAAEINKRLSRELVPLKERRRRKHLLMQIVGLRLQETGRTRSMDRIVGHDRTYPPR